MVEQVVDAAHLLLDHLHHRVLHGRRRRARITGIDLHRRRRNRRKLLDRQCPDRQAARQHDEQGDDDGEDRAVDEELGHGAFPSDERCKSVGQGQGGEVSGAARLDGFGGLGRLLF
jgi:hypothetical protein